MSVTSSNPMDPQAPGVVVSMLRYWRWSLVIVIVAAAVAYGGSLALPKRYKASAVVELSDPTADSVFPQSGSLPVDLERYTARQAIVVKSGVVLTERDQDGAGHDGQEPAQKTSTRRPGTLDRSSSPRTPGSAERAVELANGTLAGYQQYVQASPARSAPEQRDRCDPHDARDASVRHRSGHRSAADQEGRP